MIDVSDTIIAKSDQLNADDLISGPITITITEVNKPGGDQPINIKYQGGRVPFKPCKTVRRILVKAWGKDATAWHGRQMTLYNDPNVKWAGKAVGGIRVSHLSHIAHDLEISLTETRGSKKPHTIKKLNVSAPPQQQQQQAPQQDPQSMDSAPNIRLIKSDGSVMTFDNFQAWVDTMANNLPKIPDMARLDDFSAKHDPIFAEFRDAGFGEWVDKAEAIIQENANRLGGGNASAL